VSGVRGLFREAGRAAAFVRRLEQSLAPARRAVSASADLTLLRIDARLSGLTDPVDVSSALDAVMARLALAPAGDHQHESHGGRRVEAGPHACGERRHSMHPDEASPVRRHPARSRRTAAGEASAALRQSSNAIVPPRNGVVAVSERLAASPAVVRPRAANAAAAETYRAGQVPVAGLLAPSPATFHARAVAVRATAGSNGTMAPAAVNRIPYVSPSHATTVLSERMRASNTLEAFRSVVRVAPSAPADQARPGSTAVIGRPLPVEPSATSAPALARVLEAAAPLHSAAADAPAMSDRIEEGAHARRRRTPAPVVDSTLSGLRRLAALATASLDDPRPGVEPVPPSTPVVGVEEELDRILRAEALRYGIRADGLVR
jgi:hypothetical protein